MINAVHRVDALTGTGSGLQTTLALVSLTARFAISVMGSFINIEGVGFDGPAKQPAPVQFQSRKVDPVSGIAERATFDPASTHSL